MCTPFHQPEGEAKPVRGVTELIEELVVAQATIRIYAADHPRVTEALDSLSAGVEEILGNTEQEELRLGVTDGYMFVDGRPLFGASLVASRIIQPLTEMDSGGLLIERGASRDDFMAVMQLLSDKKRPLDHEAANERLAEAGCQSISLRPPFRRSVGSNKMLDTMSTTLGKTEVAPESEDMLALAIPIRLYQDIVDHLQGQMIAACRGETVDISGSQHYAEAILRRLDADPKSMLSIGRYEQYDAFTFGHSIRVCLLAACFAKALNLDEELQQRIGLASLLHDIGKSRVPFEILHSKGRLSGSERMEMNRHTLYGAEILLDAPDSDPLTVVAAFGHHRSPSSGYPRVLYAADMSTATSVIKICDVYEALTAVRPYKDRMSPVRAYRIMMSMGDHFDRGLLRRFIHVTGTYPIGSRVRLSTGEIAQVHKQTETLERPVVDIERDAEGQVYAKDAQRRVDLSRYKRQDTLKIEELLAVTGIE